MSSRSRGYYPNPVSTDQARLAVLQILLGRRVTSRWMWRKWRQSSLWDSQGSEHMACKRGWRTGVVSSSKKGWSTRLKKGWSSANTIREIKDHEVKLFLRVAGKIMKDDNIHKHCLNRFSLDTRTNFLTARTGQCCCPQSLFPFPRIFKTLKYTAMAGLVSNVSKPPATKRRLGEATSSCPIQPRPLRFCASPQEPHY